MIQAVSYPMGLGLNAQGAGLNLELNAAQPNPGSLISTGAGLSGVIRDPPYRPQSFKSQSTVSAEGNTEKIDRDQADDFIPGEPLVNFIQARRRAAETARASPPSNNGDIRDSPQFIELEFAVGRSIRYHKARAAFFSNVHQLNAAIAAISSGGTLAAAFGPLPWLTQILAAVATLTSIGTVLDEKLGFKRKSVIYNRLQCRFGDLKVKMEGATGIKEEDIRAWTAEKASIERGEPAEMRVLNMKCRNEEAMSRGYGYDQVFPLRWWQSLFAHIVSLPPYRDWVV